MSIRAIKELVLNDGNIQTNKIILDIKFGGTPKDLYHAKKRSDKRAIPIEYIWIALCYGHKKRAIKALSFTIYDKSLVNTPYYKYVSTLRGVCVIVDYNNIVITTYWLFKVKQSIHH